MITRLALSSVTQGLPKYRSMLAGNPPPYAYQSIASATGTGSSTTITFSSIPQTYQHLQIRGIVKNTFSTTSTGVGNVNITFNGVGGTSYATHTLRGSGTAASAFGDANYSSIYPNAVANSHANNTNTVGAIIIDIHDYASTTKNKTVRNFSGVDYNGGGLIELNSGVFLSTSAITSITLTTSQNWTTQTQYALYGIKGA